jgi:hypothetical protein
MGDVRHSSKGQRNAIPKSLDRTEVYSRSVSSEALELRGGLCTFTFSAPAWRNWQTRWTQNPVIAQKSPRAQEGIVHPATAN